MIEDNSSDLAVAIGEHAFRAGWEAACDAMEPPGPILWNGTLEQAWSAYTPPEELCGGGPL